MLIPGDEVIRRQAMRIQRSNGNWCEKPQYADDRGFIGKKGEYVFGAMIGQKPDITVINGGDNGIDFIHKGWSIDVKTFRKPYNMLVTEGEVKADIYMLMGMNEMNGVWCVGWEWGKVIRGCPVKEWGNTMCHYLPARELMDVQELIDIEKGIL